MTMAEMLAQIDKLNKSQLRALRHKLAGRGNAKSIHVDERISKAIVTFEYANGKDYAHHIILRIISLPNRGLRPPPHQLRK
jgi:hypothetical protein